MATSSRGRKTATAQKATDHSTDPVDRSDPNTDVMDDLTEGNELTIPSSQNPTARHALLQRPELRENITDLSLGDFLEAPLQLKEIQLNELQDQAAKINHDPASADFKALLSGRLALQELIKARSHHDTLHSLLANNRIPLSLRVNRRIHVFKPSNCTNITLRSLAQQYERKVTEVLLQHHAETISTAKSEFKKIYQKAETSPNLLILTCHWILTAHQTIKALSERRNSNRQDNNKSKKMDRNRNNNNTESNT